MVVSPSTRRLVRERANGRCEYCRIPEEEFAAATSFVAEHIRPKRDFAVDDPQRDAPDNLAWACPKCNSYKYKKTHGTDPETGMEHPLFNPRREQWVEHFVALPGGRITGRTPIGRATREALKFDEPARVKSRYLLASRQRWP